MPAYAAQFRGEAGTISKKPKHRQRLGLFAYAPETQWVAAREKHHTLALARKLMRGALIFPALPNLSSRALTTCTYSVFPFLALRGGGSAYWRGPSYTTASPSREGCLL